MAGGNGGNGTGANLNRGGAGGSFGMAGGSTSKTSSGGAGGGGAGGVGGRANGMGGTAGQSGTAQHPGGSAGRSGKVGTSGVGGGGGGNGILFTAGGVLATNASFGGGSGGAGTAGRNGRGGGGGGEGGYGIAAPGSSPTTVDIRAGAILVTGGNGGSGGAALFGTSGGSGGDGGVGVYLPTSRSSLDVSSGRIEGGNGGAAGIGSAGNGAGGAGGAGVVGAGLAVTNAGTIAGGQSGGVLGQQADAIDFTGGANTLTLGSGGKQGTLDGNIGVTGSLAIDPATAATVAATLSSVIHDTANGAGRVSKRGAGTLTLSAQSTYSGGTTLNGGTLELDGTTESKADIGPGRDTITYGAAGTGPIAFGTAGAATLQVDDIALTNPGGNTSYLAYALTGFAVGDAIDLDNLGATGATVSYKGTVLTVTANGTSDKLDINAAPTGYTYTTTTDASGAGIDVILTSAPARSSAGAQAEAATLDAPVAPASGDASKTAVSDAGGSATHTGAATADAASLYDMAFTQPQAGRNFVFSPGDAGGVVDVAREFRVGGVGHSTLDLPSADFADLAAVFANTRDLGGSALISDPVTGDAMRLAGVTTTELKQHPKDIAFHA